MNLWSRFNLLCPTLFALCISHTSFRNVLLLGHIAAMAGSAGFQILVEPLNMFRSKTTPADGTWKAFTLHNDCRRSRKRRRPQTTRRGDTLRHESPA
jgi:hypothetical protein